MQGGGIPTSIAALKGMIKFDWFKNLIGTFFLSLTSFMLGVPLGNEGPSVQMGTAVGKGTVQILPKSQRDLEQYAMAGGACAGFSTATGAPISGILFAIEEVYGKLSPFVLLFCSVCVFSARVVTELLSPLCGVHISLLPNLQLTALPVSDLWLPILVGITVGLFSVIFLKYYDILCKLLNKVLGKCPQWVLIFAILTLTVTAGLYSFSFVSTGHELIMELLENKYLLPPILILLVRTTLTLSANASGITGGVFVPILTLGAVVSGIIAVSLNAAIGLSEEYRLLILALGITASIAGTMKMPIISVVFAIEALSCHNNILPVITVAITAFAITEIFGVSSISEQVLKRKSLRS